MNEERNERTIGELTTWGPDGEWSGMESREKQKAGEDRPLEIGELETLRTKGVTELMLLTGRYRVLKRLGEGGMGSVWLAEDTKLDNRLVAIKMLPAVLAGKKGAYRQVKQEALVAMRLAHPNIATVRAFEEDEGGVPFLVMDYIKGTGLDEILSERGPLGEEEVLKLLGPVAAALDYAHSQGVVHRDVKPGNVMVRKDGTPFVLDFGIAREIQETMTRVTGKFSSGTLLYMSPEQLHGLTPKASQDVYSFAAMTYECIVGKPPFSLGQIEYQIDHDEPKDLLEGVVGEPLRQGVMAGLEKKPEKRPRACTEILGSTGKRHANSETMGAVAVTPPYERKSKIAGFQQDGGRLSDWKMGERGRLRSAHELSDNEFQQLEVAGHEIRHLSRESQRTRSTSWRQIVLASMALLGSVAIGMGWWWQAMQGRKTQVVLNQTIAQLDEERDKSREALLELDQTQSNLSDARVQLDAVRAELGDTHAKLKDFQEVANSSIDRLQEELKEKNGRIHFLEESVSKIEASKAQLATIIVQLEDAKAQLEEDNAMLDSQLRKITACTTSLQKGTTGKIIMVYPDKKTCLVDIGASAGAGTGATLIVHRNDLMLGKIRLSNIGPDISLAEIMPGYQADKIHAGDHVLF